MVLKYVSKQDLAELESLKARRAALGRFVREQGREDQPDGQSWKPKLVIQQNDRFDAEENYWFAIELKELSEGDTNRRPQEFDLYLEGIKLEPAPTTTRLSKKFLLSFAQAKQIEDRITKDTLDIKIALK